MTKDMWDTLDHFPPTAENLHRIENVRYGYLGNDLHVKTSRSASTPACVTGVL